MISCRWKFLLFLSKKNIFEDEPWPDFKNQFFLHPFRLNFGFSEKCLSRRNQNFKKIFLILLSKFLENFFFIFVEKNFSKMTFPPHQMWAKTFLKKLIFSLKKIVYLLEISKKTWIFQNMSNINDLQSQVCLAWIFLKVLGK